MSTSSESESFSPGGLRLTRSFRFESKKSPSPSEPTSFPVTSTWDEMRDHVILSHPSACVDVARLHPSQIFELRRRLSSPNVLVF